MKPLLKQGPQPKLTAYEKIDYLRLLQIKLDASPPEMADETIPATPELRS